MLKKFAIGIALIISVVAPAVLAGCGDVDYDEKFSDRAKVIFELEGGKYLNSTTNVSHYYMLVDGKCKITALEEMPDSEVTRDGGFVLEGWYRTKTTAEDGKAEYSDRWDFENDTVSAEGVTLYAKWEPPVVYSFDFVYIDESGNEVVVSSRKVSAGKKFGEVYTGDVLNYAGGYANHTAIAVYYDAGHTKPFDDSVAHPGGEESYAVKLYVEYIEGTYTVVKTKEQMKTAALMGNSIYLLADIDMGGEELTFNKFSGKTLEGNGFKISNFTVKSKSSKSDLVDLEGDGNKSLCVAIFANLDGATVRDVTFENITFKVDNTAMSDIYKIYVAPLAVSATGCKFENVEVTGKFGYTKKTASAFDIEKVLVFWTESGICKNENSTEQGCRYDITLAGEIQ